MHNRVAELKKLLTFIQLRVKCIHLQRLAKLEILDNSWNKLLGQIHECNESKVKSKRAYDLIVAIGSIKTVVKRRALEEFLRCSQRVNTIAFLQWRKKFPNKMTKKD